jgi:hypothetical protein
MTLRMMILFFLAILAAAPLVWMSVDPNAGNKLLALTSGSKVPLALSNQPQPAAPKR